MPGPRCSPPKGVSVRDYLRGKPRRKRKAKSSTAAYVVRNSRTGTVVSRHRTLTAAVRERKRLDLASYRRGQGRPYDVEKRT